MTPRSILPVIFDSEVGRGSDLLGNDSFGRDSGDIELQSVMPLSPSELPKGGITAPLISVGTARQTTLDRATQANKVEPALDRGLVFVASAGHHSTGLNGPGNVVAQNPELIKNT